MTNIRSTITAALLGLGSFGCQTTSSSPAPAPALVSSGAAAKPDTQPITGAPTASTPGEFRERGKLVCIPEEMQRLHRALIPPVHTHVIGLRVTGLDEAGRSTTKIYTILRNESSEALFADARFAESPVEISGRLFEEARVVEVNGVLRVRGGQLVEPFYWCEVCAIVGLRPGECECCQGEVEYREKPFVRAN